MKKVMILTSEKTGNGHRMAANAIEKKLLPMDYDVKKVNCFTKMGKMGVSMENSYIPITTKKTLALENCTFIYSNFYWYYALVYLS